MKKSGRAIKLKLTKEHEKLWKILVFFVRLMVLSVPLYLVMYLGIDLYVLQEAVAYQSAQILALTGLHVEQNRIMVKVGTENPLLFVIDSDCTEWKSMLFFSALIFAVPGVALKKRLSGILLGIPLIWAGNILRVVTTVMIERQSGIETALMLHDFAFRFGMAALVLVTWYLWLVFVCKTETIKAHSR